MTESAFSSSAQAIIQSSLVIEKQDGTRAQLSAEQFNDHYELEWTANEIISKNYTRVSIPLSPTEMGSGDRNTSP
jgi:hypothetical protein